MAGTVLGVLAVSAVVAWGQVAPSGGHEPSVGPGAGLGGAASPTGGYGTAIPIDLPSPRGHVPLPLSVSYGGSPRAGAAGVGWNVPISYVRRSRTTWQRKPLATGDGTQAAERILVSVGGAAQLMVPSGNVYVPFAGAAYQELRPEGTGWSLRTLDNVEYVFAPVADLGFTDPDLWVLAEIRDLVGGDQVVLHYDQTPFDQCGPELNLAGFDYTFDEAGTPLYTVALTYEPWWRPDTGVGNEFNHTTTCSARTGPSGGTELAPQFEHVRDGALAFDRARLLTRIDVMARNNLDPAQAPRTIRAYHLSYSPAIATDKPLLTAVTMTGDDGATSVPVATYDYGQLAAPAPYGQRPVLDWTMPQAIARGLPAGSPDLGALARTEVDVEELVTAQGVIVEAHARRETSRAVNVLRDFTGDGLPDLVVFENGQWTLYRNQLTPSGPDLSQAVSTWTQPYDLHVETTFQFDLPTLAEFDWARQAMITTEVWTDFMDWNGDGRLDIVDTRGGQDDDHWRVWLNDPAPNNGVTWRPIQVDVAPLRAHQLANGFAPIDHDGFFPLVSWPHHLPLQRSRSWPRVENQTCQEWTCGGSPFSCTEPYTCSPDPSYLYDHSVDTIVEWQVADANGDGFPDFVTVDLPVRECETRVPGTQYGECAFDPPEPPGSGSDGEYQCTDLHRQYLWNHADGPGAQYCDPIGSTLPSLVRFLNRTGPYTAAGGSPFATTPEFVTLTDTGVGHWTTGTDSTRNLPPPDPSVTAGMSWQSTGFVDRHGDGEPELVWIDQLDDLAHGVPAFDSDRHEACKTGPGYYDSNPFTSRQVRGEADLDGDGLPDDIVREEPIPGIPVWFVRFNTGAGYGPERQIGAPFSGDFELSLVAGTCGGDTATTVAITDLDGDGKADLLRISGGVLYMWRLEPADGDLLSTNRLTTIGNGYGATTHVEYADAKREDPVGRVLPFPEVVVARTWTSIDDGSGPGLAPVYYAYGRGELAYDPLFGRWGFPGYRRQISLAGRPQAGGGTGGALVDGVLTITDLSPAAPPGASYADHVRAYRPVSTIHHEGAIDPAGIWQYVTIDGGSPIGQTTAVHAAHELVPAQGSSPPDLDCADLDPATGQAAGGGRCGSAGLVYAVSTDGWQGDAAPPSLANVLAGSAVDEVDAYGRPTRLSRFGDLRRTDDDVCTTLTYVSGAGGAFPSVPSAMVVTDCGWNNPVLGGPAPAPGTPEILSAVHFFYDGLPEGQASVGRLTSRQVDRYDETGFLDSHVVDTLDYGALGRVVHVAAARSLGTPSVHDTFVTYDSFGLTITSLSETATDVPTSFTRTSATSTWPSLSSLDIDHQGVMAMVEHDALGRPVRTSLIDTSGLPWTRSRTTYDDDPAGRRLITESFPGDVAYGSEDQAERQRATTVLDALGRPRFTQRELGSDYADTTLITGLVEYDELGRVAYVADPFEWPELPFVPGSLTTLPYGTTTTFDGRGRATRAIEAPGRNETALVTSVPDDVFVSSLQYAYGEGLALTVHEGPDDNDPASLNTAYRDLSRATALGREVERARAASTGARVDLVRSTWDRLGRVIETHRYQDPVAETGDVVWRSHFDSLGRRLSVEEPGVATTYSSHDELGNELETWYQDGTKTRITRASYDGFGRVTERSILWKKGGGEHLESRDTFHYDAHSGSGDQPAGLFAGRLSWVETEGASGLIGDVYYAADDLGRNTSTTYAYTGHAGIVRESSTYTVGGRLGLLRLDTSTTSDQAQYEYDSANRVRRIRAPGGTVWFDATGITADGHYDKVMRGNGVEDRFDRAPDGRREPLGWTATTAAGTFAHTNDLFDGDGRVLYETEVTPTGTSNRAYQFGPLGQLDQAIHLGGGWPGVEIYTHDPLGNLLTRSATTGIGDRVYTYDPVDLDRTCRYAEPNTSGPCTFTYDAIGNVTADTSDPAATRTFKYDSAGRLLVVKRGDNSVTFTHGPAGRAHTDVLTDGSTPSRTIWHFGLVEERDLGGPPIIERRIPGPLGVAVSLRDYEGHAPIEIYGHGDGRGDRLFTDATGQPIQQVTYGTFGQVTSNDNTSPWTGTDDLWNGGDNFPEVGLTILGPRAYDPALGRFLQRDPIAITTRASSANPYAFAFSDPVNFGDPSGLISIDIVKWVNGAGGWLGSGSIWPAVLANAIMTVSNYLDQRGGGAAGATADLSKLSGPFSVPSASSWAAGTATGTAYTPGVLETVGDVAVSAGKFAYRYQKAKLKATYNLAKHIAGEAIDAAECGVKGIVCVYERVRDAPDDVANFVRSVGATAQAAADDPAGFAENIACPGGDCVQGYADMEVTTAFAMAMRDPRLMAEVLAAARGGAGLLRGLRFRLSRGQRAAIERLRSGADVTVRTVEEARSLIREMPDLRPATEGRLMPNPSRTMRDGFSDPPGTYRGDLINKSDPTGPIHPSVANPNHANNPHYNIKFRDGTKATIIIKP